MFLRICLSILILLAPLHAASIKSITGQILLDSNNDGVGEAKISADGLAVGSGISPSANLHISGNGIVSNNLVVGSTTGNSTLHVAGSYGFNLETISDNTTLSANSVAMVNSSNSDINVILPYAGNVTGRRYTIKKINSSNEVILGGGGNLIDGNDIYTLSSGNLSSISVISNGEAWYVIDLLGSGVTGGDNVVAGDNLVGWWKLDETTGTTAVDSSGQGNNGTLEAGMTNSDWVSGQINNGLDFDGNDYVDMGDPAILDNFGDKITLSAWVKGTSTSSVIVGKSHNSSHADPYYCYLIYVAANKLHSRMDSTTVTGSVTINDNQ